MTTKGTLGLAENLVRGAHALLFEQRERIFREFGQAFEDDAPEGRLQQLTEEGLALREAMERLAEASAD